MLIKRISLVFSAIVFCFVVSSAHGGDIISCDSFENCLDGSEPVTNALLALEARMDALEAENAALKALLEANTAADASAHHTKYKDSESIAAVGPHFSGDHSDLTNVTAIQHHAKYTNAEAVEAVDRIVLTIPHCLLV